MNDPRTRVEHIKQLGGTPYMGFAAKAWADLVDTGYADRHIQLIAWDHSAVVAFRGDLGHKELVGIITYLKYTHSLTFAIHIGYVLPILRRGGIYRCMWDELVLKAREEGFAHIIGAVRYHNTKMRAAAEALGREAESVNYTYEVPSEP